MFKRLSIVFILTIAIIMYFYLHGRMWQIFSPDKFGEMNFWVYIVSGIPIGTLFGLMYFCVAAIFWPIIGGIINYVSRKEICSIPNDCDADFSELE